LGFGLLTTPLNAGLISFVDGSTQAFSGVEIWAYHALFAVVGFLCGSLSDLRVRLETELAVRKLAEQERESLIRRLQKTLGEVETLSGLLPICANCKRIQDGSGEWQPLEDYISGHSDADFTHGICPVCARRLYPDLFDGEPDQDL